MAHDNFKYEQRQCRFSQLQTSQLNTKSRKHSPARTASAGLGVSRQEGVKQIAAALGDRGVERLVSHVLGLAVIAQSQHRLGRAVAIRQSTRVHRKRVRAAEKQIAAVVDGDLADIAHRHGLVEEQVQSQRGVGGEERAVDEPASQGGRDGVDQETVRSAGRVT